MPKDRKEQIKDILTEKPFVSLHELEAKFPEVTSMTLRRDIAYLESRGELIKVRGGARSMKFITSSMEDEFGKRLHECTEEKARIALAALAFIEPNRSIFIDSGTTALALASVVPDQHIIFTTTGPHVAIELAKNRKNIVNLVGGMINHDNFSVSGMEALRFVSEINIDIAFMVPSCVSVSCGFTCGNYIGMRNEEIHSRKGNAENCPHGQHEARQKPAVYLLPCRGYRCADNRRRAAARFSRSA